MGAKCSKCNRVDARYLVPQGLYPASTVQVDLKKLKKLILDRKLAPCTPGVDESSGEDLEECPICFLHYPALNRTHCCGQTICSECFLQVKSPAGGGGTLCPYCKGEFAVFFKGPRTALERLRSQKESQQVIEATIRARQAEEQRNEAEALQRTQQAQHAASQPLPEFAERLLRAGQAVGSNPAVHAPTPSASSPLHQRSSRSSQLTEASTSLAGTTGSSSSSGGGGGRAVGFDLPDDLQTLPGTVGGKPQRRESNAARQARFVDPRFAQYVPQDILYGDDDMSANMDLNELMLMQAMYASLQDVAPHQQEPQHEGVSRGQEGMQASGSLADEDARPDAAPSSAAERAGPAEEAIELQQAPPATYGWDNPVLSPLNAACFNGQEASVGAEQMQGSATDSAADPAAAGSSAATDLGGQHQQQMQAGDVGRSLHSTSDGADTAGSSRSAGAAAELAKLLPLSPFSPLTPIQEVSRPPSRNSEHTPASAIPLSISSKAAGVEGCEASDGCGLLAQHPCSMLSTLSSTCMEQYINAAAADSADAGLHASRAGLCDALDSLRSSKSAQWGRFADHGELSTAGLDTDSMLASIYSSGGFSMGAGDSQPEASAPAPKACQAEAGSCAEAKFADENMAPAQQANRPQPTALQLQLQQPATPDKLLAEAAPTPSGSAPTPQTAASKAAPQHAKHAERSGAALVNVLACQQSCDIRVGMMMVDRPGSDARLAAQIAAESAARNAGQDRPPFMQGSHPPAAAATAASSAEWQSAESSTATAQGHTAASQPAGHGVAAPPAATPAATAGAKGLANDGGEPEPVLIENPDGSAQFVLLLTEEQQAQQAQQAEERCKAEATAAPEELAVMETYMAPANPHDLAVRDAIIRGDEALQRVYTPTPQASAPAHPAVPAVPAEPAARHAEDWVERTRLADLALQEALNRRDALAMAASPRV